MTELISARPAPAILFALLCALIGSMTESPAQPAPDKANIDRGEQIYQDYCATCHGDGLQNTSNGVTYDLRRLRADERARFVNGVLGGKGQMPPWRGALETEQVELIWLYVRAVVDR